MIIHAGHEEYSQECNDQDFQLCKQLTCEKPQPAVQEFLELASIMMEEENLQMPTNPQEALELYLELVENINCS